MGGVVVGLPGPPPLFPNFDPNFFLAKIGYKVVCLLLILAHLSKNLFVANTTTTILRSAIASERRRAKVNTIDSCSILH